jgi:hypothetical protein
MVAVPPPAGTKRAVRLTDPGAITERLDLPQEAGRRLQRRGFLRQLDLHDAETASGCSAVTSRASAGDASVAGRTCYPPGDAQTVA